ncbi:mitochondrial copper ion transporter [Hirsutella rhossiliensis]|uniref:Mitochondrial copper ion transporter n=1 Tax=Hirsutella rhossiliensis TaxID=111463 RepID=A0A9P8SDF6_9HYPO|nr:mitochondrial copper ion transporter [Hirsutella rhossiliensis]KAH0957290.1 mitochondrial copper ion transporter [Hirsutella rhossiliensis]
MHRHVPYKVSKATTTIWREARVFWRGTLPSANLLQTTAEAIVRQAQIPYVEAMSTFGSPGKLPSTKPTPPQRGSFPLDHDGECKHVIPKYIACMNNARGINDDECRNLMKAYLACRMDRNLMAKDDFKNLGFAETPKPYSQVSKSEKGVKGELRW